jgi:hypothetical protein
VGYRVNALLRTQAAQKVLVDNLGGRPGIDAGHDGQTLGGANLARQDFSLQFFGEWLGGQGHPVRIVGYPLEQEDSAKGSVKSGVQLEKSMHGASLADFGSPDKGLRAAPQSRIRAKAANESGIGEIGDDHGDQLQVILELGENRIPERVSHRPSP